jgi:cell wall-associated NlpC family hydrolase
MASMRPAASFLFFVCAIVAGACVPHSVVASPSLPTASPIVGADENPLASDVRLDVPHAKASPRRVLADFALKLRNIAYVRGGRELTTGFDCSGFVRYVYQHSLGAELPSNSGSQFASGNAVDRDALRMGDLVFFRTEGRRVSHVGIYLDNGLFIHAPSRGKRVRIDHLDEKYWTKHFAGAKRPDALTS